MFYFLSNQKFERLDDPFDEIVTVSLHKGNVLTQHDAILFKTSNRCNARLLYFIWVLKKLKNAKWWLVIVVPFGFLLDIPFGRWLGSTNGTLRMQVGR